jgi:cytochrome c biogenesis factor
MAEIGFYLLYVGLILAALGVAASIMGATTHSRSLIVAGERGSLAVCAILTLAMAMLGYLFLANDF